jgi:hypothetical protein
LRISLNNLHVGGMSHIVDKILKRATKKISNLLQLKIYTKSYGFPKWQKSQFRDSWLRSHGKNDNWVQPPWPVTKNTIKKKVVACPKSESWWVIWVCVCSWLVHAPKMFKLCTNQLIIWFLHIHMNNWPTCHLS